MRVADLAYALERGVAMHHDGVGGEAVRGEELFAVGRPLDGCHLRGRRERMQACARGGIPDVDGRVVGAATGGEKSGLPVTPCNGLNRRV